MRFQGPRANGMPELHALTPALASLQDAGRHVALVTDGRMSGASGKVPAAIHVSPEVLAGGPLGRVRDGDIIRLDADSRHAAKRWCRTRRVAARARWRRPTCRPTRSAWAANCLRCSVPSVSAAEEGAATFGLPPPLHLPEKRQPLAVPDEANRSR